MTTEREKLIEYLDSRCIDSYGELQTWQVVDFILTDRKRIVEPLVELINSNDEFKWHVTRTKEAIDQTLKNAGVNT